jgi:thiol-disulfide isomerase/thioredoxin
MILGRRPSRLILVPAAALLVAVSCDSGAPLPPATDRPASPAISGNAGEHPEHSESAVEPSTVTAQPKTEHQELAQTDGDVRVDLQLLDVAGIQQLIARYRGKIVVLDAWSTACPPCIKEFPRLVELHRKSDPSDVACISLSFDYEGLDPPEKVRDRVLRFLEKQGAGFDNILSTVESLDLLKQMGIPSLPAVLVYDRQGRLVRQFGSEGEEFTYTNVETLLAGLLQGAGPEERNP